MQKFSVFANAVKVAILYLHDKNFMVLFLIIAPVITRGHKRSTLPQVQKPHNFLTLGAFSVYVSVHKIMCCGLVIIKCGHGEGVYKQSL